MPSSAQALALSGGRAPAANGGGGASGGGGTGGGGTDGPAWNVYNSSAAVVTGSPNVDYGNLQNSVQGAQAIGQSRSAQILIINTSKKTALTITQVDVEGRNPSDFTISAASLSATVNHPIPANKNQGTALQIAFAPSAQGARNATLRIVSNAGTSLSSLSGVGLPPDPVISTSDSLAFLAGSAPATLTITNRGSKALILNSWTLGGASPDDFVLASTQHFSNCFAGVELAANSSCFIGVGPVSTATAPASAVLAIASNDPATPVHNVALSITP